MQAYSITEARNNLPKKKTIMEKYVDSINECIERESNSGERQVIYLIEGSLYPDQIRLLINIYSSEGYSIYFNEEFMNFTKVIVEW